MVHNIHVDPLPSAIDRVFGAPAIIFAPMKMR